MMALVRHDFARRLLPERLARGPVQGQDHEAVLVGGGFAARSAAAFASRRALAIGRAVASPLALAAGWPVAAAFALRSLAARRRVLQAGGGAGEQTRLQGAFEAPGGGAGGSVGALGGGGGLGGSLVAGAGASPPDLIAVRTYTRSPHTIGVAWPRPGTATFQRTLRVSLHSVGGSP